MISADWVGVPEMQRTFEQMRTQILPAAGIALGREGDRILTESQALVPVLTGALRSSAVRQGPEQSGMEVTVTLRYGHYGRIPYAVRQEFDVTLNHPRGGQAHFLQAPFLAATDGMAQRLGDDIWPQIRGR